MKQGIKIMAPGFRDYLTLCKPRVVLLMLLTAWAGMYLGATKTIPWWLWVNATAGIGLLSGAAATLNHIIDHQIDARMERTMQRPIVTGKITVTMAWWFAIIQSLIGFVILYIFVNPLTAYLTLCAAIGYSAVYSIYLKRATSQNIVIGGLSGAMPPLLGWTAVTGQLDPQAWLLVLIIFTWTPAHFWALCLYRFNEYKKSGFPMLPITHGIPFTKLNIIFYSLLTIACSLLPYAIGMSGELYFISALLLDAGLIVYALRLQFSTTDNRIALKTFNYSLVYLTALFIVLLLDHHMLVT